MKATLCLIVLILSMNSAFAEDQAEADQAIEERYGHLERGKSGFRETWVNPNTDWTKFENLYLWDAEFQFRDVGPARRTRSTMLNTRQREFGISEEDRLKFEEVVSDIFVEEIQKAKNFTLTEEIGPNTLILRGGVLDIISNVPPDAVGMVDVYLATVGEATLFIELIDVSDGEVAAVVAERRAFQSHGGNIDLTMRTTSVTAWAEVRRWARREAATLRKELERAIAGD